MKYLLPIVVLALVVAVSGTGEMTDGEWDVGTDLHNIQDELYNIDYYATDLQAMEDRLGALAAAQDTIEAAETVMEDAVATPWVPV